METASTAGLTLADISAHYFHLLLQYAFGAAVTAVIVMIIHRVFQRFLLSTLDEVRDSTKVFRALLSKKGLTDADKALLGRLTLAYAVLSGLVFNGIITLLSNLATPVG